MENMFTAADVAVADARVAAAMVESAAVTTENAVAAVQTTKENVAADAIKIA